MMQELDAEGSDYALAYLKMGLDLSRAAKHLEEWWQANEHIICRLTQQDKDTLREVWKDTRDRLRKDAA